MERHSVPHRHPGRRTNDLPRRLLDEEITVYHHPTVYRHFIDTLNETNVRTASDSGRAQLPQLPQLPNVRLVVLGGEEVNRGDVDAYRNHSPTTVFS